MKIASLLCAGALALATFHAADAKSGANGMKKKTVRTHMAAPAKMQRTPQKDPWAAYWQDQSRYEFPSWSGRGGW